MDALNTSSSNISRVVMRRVRFLHTVRPIASGTALAALVFLLALWGIGREVWVAHVFANMPRIEDVAAVAKFFAAAFLNTRFIVQVLAVVAAAALIWLARELARTIGHIAHFA